MSEAGESSSAAGGWGDYGRGGLRSDVVAGVMLAAFLIPAGLGNATLAGLPPQSGLYSVLFAGLVFWLFCSSRHTAVTTTSAISLLVGTTLGPIAQGDVARMAALASCTAVLVGVIAFLAWLVRAGALVSFISETVLVGFKTGVALVLLSTQLPVFFGYSAGGDDFWSGMWHFVTHLNRTHGASLAAGGVAMGLLVVGKWWLRRVPMALVVLLLSLPVAHWLNLGERGVALLGEVPQGFPAIGLPAVAWREVNGLLPLAMACFLLGAVETVAIGRMFGLKHGYRIDANREFMGLAGSNLACGLGQGFAVSGGMSQSLVNEGSGARSPLSGLVASGVVLVVTVFFSGVLKDLPRPVLAAVVLMTVSGLIQPSVFKRLWRFNRGEFAVAAVATVVVLGSGILNGVMIGVVLSIVILLGRASKPHVAVLGRVPGTQLYGDISRNPENEPVAGVLIFRMDASLLYFNVDHVRQKFQEAMDAQPGPVRAVVWCLATTPFMDLAGADLLEQLHGELERKGVRLVLAEAHGPLRRTLRRAGMEARFGPIEENATVARVLAGLSGEGVAAG